MSVFENGQTLQFLQKIQKDFQPKMFLCKKIPKKQFLHEFDIFSKNVFPKNIKINFGVIK